jgi:TPR repeat protein
MRGALTILKAGVAVLSLWLALPAQAEAPDFATALAAIEAGNPARAVAIFTALAVAGEAPAQLNLAVLTARGTGIPQNDLDAAYWAWRARLAGLPAAVAPADVLLARLAPEAVAVLSVRLASDLDALAEGGADWAFLARARLELQLATEPDPVRAYGLATLAAALSVPGAMALRDALAPGLAPEARLEAQAEATARFVAICAGAARPACADVPDPSGS